MTSRSLRIAAVLAASTVFAVMVGCVDEDPIISGHRSLTDAGSPSADTGPSRPPPSPLVPLDDFPGGNDVGDVDDPKCRHCAETLDTDNARGTLCRKNDVAGSGKSSVATLNALVDCLCYDKCPEKCSNYCAGGKRENPCAVCLSQFCSAEVSACLDDHL